jgi:hypothetical protein
MGRHSAGGAEMPWSQEELKVLHALKSKRALHEMMEAVEVEAHELQDVLALLAKGAVLDIRKFGASLMDSESLLAPLGAKLAGA